MSSIRYVLVFLAAVSGVSCQGAAAPAAADPAGAALPPRARVPLSALPGEVRRPVNAPGWDELPEAVAEYVRQAEELLAKGQNARAGLLLEKAREAAPDSPRIALDLGLAHAGLRKFKEAKQLLTTASASAPDHVRLQLLLGQYAVLDGDAAEAMKRFRTALRCSDARGENPDTAEATLRLAALLEQQGYLKAAAEGYRNLCELVHAHGPVYARRPFLRTMALQPERCMLAEGRALLKLGEAGPAAVVLERAYRRNKTHQDTALLAVQALVAGGEVEAAEGIVMEMLREPRLRPLLVRAGLALCRGRKAPAEPLRLLRAGLDDPAPFPAFLVAMAEAAARRGAAAEAAQALAEHLTGDPDDKPVALALARLRAQTGEPPAAVRIYARLLRADDADVATVRRELARLVRAGTGEALIDDLAAEADPAEGALKPALLTVAGLLADLNDEPDRAGKLLRRAVKADAKFWPAYEALEAVLVAAGDFAAADALVRDVAAVAGEHPFRFYLTGKSQLDRRRFAEAVSSLEQARTRRGRHVPTLLLLGRAHAARGMYRDAERRLLTAYAVAPRDLAVVAAVYRLYVAARRGDDAARVLRRFLQDDPQSIPGRVLLAAHHRLTARQDLARDVLGELLAEAPDDVEVRLLELELDMPRSLAGEAIPADEAEALIQKARHVLQLDGRSRRAAGLLAALLANQGRHAEAAEVLAPLHARRPRDATVANAYVKALIEAGSRDEALRRLEALAGMKHLPGALRRAVLDRLIEIEQFKKAEACAEAWLADPTDEAKPEARRFRALGVYKKTGSFDKALAMLDKWIAGAGESALGPMLRQEKVFCLALAKRYDDAIAFAKQWQAQAGDDTARGALVVALMESKAYEKALPVLTEFIQAGGDERLMQRCRRSQLHCHAELGRFDELVKLAREWIAQEPESPLPRGVAVAELVAHDQYDLALAIASEWLEGVEKSDPSAEGWAKDLQAARELVVHILLAADRKKQALRRAQAFVQADAENVAARRLLAGVYASMDKEGDYLAELEKVYQLDPDHAGANNDLGYSWADRGVRLAEAERMIRKALAQRPNEIAFKDSLGWVLYKQGRLLEGKRMFDGVTDADEADLHPVILDHAGDTCWRLGLKTMALRLWARAVALAKKSEHKGRETRDVLKNTPRKIADGQKGRRPKVAPLGKGVTVPPGG